MSSRPLPLKQATSATEARHLSEIRGLFTWVQAACQRVYTSSHLRWSILSIPEAFSTAARANLPTDKKRTFFHVCVFVFSALPSEFTIHTEWNYDTFHNIYTLNVKFQNQHFVTHLIMYSQKTCLLLTYKPTCALKLIFLSLFMLLVTHYVWLSHLYVICLLPCGDDDDDDDDDMSTISYNIFAIYLCLCS